MRVEVARYAGVCYGVERALNMAEEAAAAGTPVRTLGPLIHNPQAVDALRAKGVEVAGSLDEADDGTLVIRTHGVDPAIIRSAHEKGLDVVDATCPHVTKAHEAAEELTREGYYVVVVGEADHPEVEGIMAHTGGDVLVVGTAAELPDRLPSRRIGVVVQTTQSEARLSEVVGALVGRTSDLRVFNTICSATTKRQQSAESLAETVDVMVVVGGRNSGNTTRLVEVCRSVNPRVYHVETPEELRPEWFVGASVVGVTAGASTPDEQMRGVVAAIEAME
jgi:4-hydroxy-3-methylbut-2-enyl diphosphate reductase